MARLRIVFFGSAELSCVSLEALLGQPDFEVVGVVTQPDRPKGRSLKLQPPPVKVVAQRTRLPALQPERAREEKFLEDLRGLVPDLVAVAAYGQILPKAILDLPRFGCLNVHTSLLPKYRGAAPIQWALLNDEAETGVTIMKMDAGLDTGDILAQQRTAIADTDDAPSLHDRLAKLGAELLVRTIPGYIAGKIHPRPQPAAGATLAPKIKKEDGHIDWAMPARVIWNRVRAFTPWPGAFTHWPAQPGPQMLKIWQAEVASQKGRSGEVLQADRAGLVIGCGAGALRVLQVQPESGRRMSAPEFVAGHSLEAGRILD